MVRASWGVERSGENTKVSGTLAGKPFPEQLKGYFGKYAGDDLESYALAKLVKEVNSRLGSAPADEFHPLSESVFKHMLAGKVGPTPALVEAFSQVFLQERIGFFGDARRAFAEEGAKAAAAESARRMKASTRQNVLRVTNPGGDLTRPSFQEMLEKAYRERSTFKDFLFKKVLPAWGLDKQGFIRHLEQRNHDRQGRKTLTLMELDTWEKESVKPIGECMGIICDAFAIKPEGAAKMASHEAMLWRLSGGHVFQWKNGEGVDALKQAVIDSRASGNAGELVTELCSASGIPYQYMQDLLASQQLANWKNGTAHIEDTAKAADFVELVNPCLNRTEEEWKACSRDIFSVVTNRPNDLDEVIKTAKTRGNPSGALFALLTGREGMITISTDDLIKETQAAGTGFTKRALFAMRNPESKRRGTDINEMQADAIMTLVEERMKRLVERGMLAAISEKQKDECVDILTGSPHPKKMLESCLKGEMRVREMIRRTYERKGIKQQGEEGLSGQAGINNLSAFLTHEDRHLTPDVARRLAVWFEINYNFSEKRQRQLMALAQGIDLKQSPDEILNAVIAGSMDRLSALRMLYDQTGLSRGALADAAHVPGSLIQYSVTEASGGRIASKEIPGPKSWPAMCVPSRMRSAWPRAPTNSPDSLHR